MSFLVIYCAIRNVVQLLTGSSDEPAHQAGVQDVIKSDPNTSK